MKFNISLKVLPLLACGMLMASCNDFLKQEPLTDITPTDYYKDATQLQAVLPSSAAICSCTAIMGWMD